MKVQTIRAEKNETGLRAGAGKKGENAEEETHPELPVQFHPFIKV